MRQPNIPTPHKFNRHNTKKPIKHPNESDFPPRTPTPRPQKVTPVTKIQKPGAPLGVDVRVSTAKVPTWCEIQAGYVVDYQILTNANRVLVRMQVIRENARHCVT